MGLTFVVAVAVRLAHAAYVAKTPFFEGPIIDAMVYRNYARNLAETGDLGPAFYQPPLYPIFLALLEKLGLGSPWSVSVVQIAMGSATAALLVILGRRAGGPEPRRARVVGLGTGLVAALYGPLVLFDLEFLPPSLVLLLFVAALVALLRSGPPGPTDALAGALLGLSVVGWPLVAVAAGGSVVMRCRRAGSARVARATALFVLAAAVPPAFATAVHNARHGAPGVVVSFNSGINLWLGNNPSWRDTWRARPGAAFEPEFERPDREGATTPTARAEFFERAVVKDTLARPGAFVRRTLEKAYYVWHGREIRRNQDIQTLRRASPVLRALLWEFGLRFPFGLLGPLALCAVLRRRAEPEIRATFATAAVYGLLLAVYFAAARYRLPMVLLLIPLAVDQAVFFVRERPGVRAAAPFAVLALVLNLPNAFTATFEATPAERETLLAQSYRVQDAADRAEEISRSIVDRYPNDANVQMLRAELLVDAGRCREALVPLQRATAAAPRATTPWVLLGTCYGRLERLPEAERAFATALSLHPFHGGALKRAAVLYATHGRFVEARALFERFSRAGYADPEVTAWLHRLEADPKGGR